MHQPAAPCPLLNMQVPAQDATASLTRKTLHYNAHATTRVYSTSCAMSTPQGLVTEGLGVQVM